MGSGPTSRIEAERCLVVGSFLSPNARQSVHDRVQPAHLRDRLYRFLYSAIHQGNAGAHLPALVPLVTATPTHIDIERCVSWITDAGAEESPETPS